MRLRLADVLAILVYAPRSVTAAHYEQPPCQVDEVQGEVQGASGYVCSPKCEASTHSCVSDLPVGTTATAQCMLQDDVKGAYCGLVCQVDTQCPAGAKCHKLAQADIGMCLYPISFSDWAKSVATVKLIFGYPSQGGAGVASFQIAKTYQALQNMKTRYSVDDGDKDMVTLKELLASLSVSQAAPVTAQAGSPAVAALPAVQAGYPAVATTLSPEQSWEAVLRANGASAPTTITPPVTTASPYSASSDYVPTPLEDPPAGLSAVMDSMGFSTETAPVKRGLGVKEFSHDIKTFEDQMKKGPVQGLKNIAKGAEWNIEHMQEQNAASTLLRGFVLCFLCYIALGSAYKFYMLDASGMEVIPNIRFWMEYPSLVADGVKYTRQTFYGNADANKMHDTGRGGGSGAFESM